MHKAAFLLRVCAVLLAVPVQMPIAAAAVALDAPQRRLVLDGIHNLRDLGGYETSDGRRVRWGLLFRSSDLTDASAKDRAVLNTLGISTVCDLRNGSERAMRPDPQLANWQFDDRCHSVNTDTQSLKPSKDQPTDWHALFAEFYRGMGKRYAPQYRAMFDDLKQNKSLLLHCTAGKDRTGVGSALILLALGVPRTTVIADYQLTNQFQAPASVLANHPELAGIPALKEAKPDYINAALDGIDAEYGNLDNYFAIELKLSAADRTQLRNFYLTPTTH